MKPAAPPSEVDKLAPWLLRVGIDHTGELVLNRLWDLAVRAAVVADLRSGNRIVDTADSAQVDTETTGLSYEDEACSELLRGDGLTEFEWLMRGHLRAADVAHHLVTTGEWHSHIAPLSIGLHKYTAPEHQYVPLRTRIAHTYDGGIAPRSHNEAALAVLGHALNVVRPALLNKHSKHPIDAYACGDLSELVAAVVAEIRAEIAESRANPNVAW